VSDATDGTTSDMSDNIFTILNQTAPLWVCRITLKDGGGAGQSSVVTFGQHPNATSGLDQLLGEVELPPAPPTGILDARFILPTTNPIGSLLDLRDTISTQLITWVLSFQPGELGYPMRLDWDPSLLPAGNFYLKDRITGSIVNVNMKVQNSFTLTNSGIATLAIEGSKEITIPVSFAVGWNLVSVPILASDMSVLTLFPNSNSSAYQFDNGYQTIGTMQNGKGYWLQFANQGSVNVHGNPISSKNISVKSDWNIIGPFDQNVSVSNITSTPTNIVTSNYFGYSNGYTQSTTLEIGKGYWIKVSQAGTLNLSGGSSSIIAKTSTENKSHWSSIVVEDNTGMQGTLYLAAKNELGTMSELPPVPPSGVFDVRYGSNRQVESVETGHYELYLSSASYPLKIRGENLGGKVYEVKDGVDGTLVQAELREGGEVTISMPLNHLTLEAIETTKEMPLTYELGQNYPNPFNPTTIIPFTLSQAGQVHIVVYNVLGEVVKELVNRNYDAGQYRVEFNASQLVSGFYICKMQVGSFIDSKKIMLLK